MFDLAWSEIALIGVVALVVIGPKDLPEAVRGIARGIAKLRRMAGEFQSQADDLVREAKLDEVRNSINDVRNTVNDIRNFNIRDEIEKTVDADGSLRKTMAENPLAPETPAWTPPPVSAPPPEAMEGANAGPPPPPAFVPPAYIPAPAAAVSPPAAPAFVPPAPAAAASAPPQKI
jgi:sec-independent protein translocase protein TatB